jgi:23S rRNA (adenine2503-C2)-methyltransferase
MNRMRILDVRTFVHQHSSKPVLGAGVSRPIKDYKVTLELDDGLVIQAGIFEIDSAGVIETHACISSQVGCKMHCTFCSSGKNGFARNLSAWEICSQVSLMEHILGQTDGFDRLMYMGIGEPLDNLKNVVTSMHNLVTFHNKYERNMSLATVGHPMKLAKFAKYGVQLRYLWVSLHAVFDGKRSEIMPFNKQGGVERTITAAVDFSVQTGTSTWLNYMILKGFNDQPEDAKRLVSLLRSIDKTVSISIMLTRPNGMAGGDNRTKPEDIQAFRDLLMETGLKNESVVFLSFGNEVEAGCGEFIFTPVV